MKRFTQVITISALAAAMVACGGEGSSDTVSTGSVSVGLTDAPVDGAEAVYIEIEALVLNRSGGNRIRFDFDMAERVNLLELNSGAVMALLENRKVEAGEYNWMRLELGDNNNIVIGGNSYSLTMPSARGVQTSGFTVPAGGEVDLTIDFDVRKSIIDPQNSNDYKLKPVVRLVDNAKVGTIQGRVAGEIISAQCSSENAGSTTSYNGSVYIHQDFGAKPDDIGSQNEPLAAIPVKYLDDQYEYTAAFLPAGNYTLSYSCGNDRIETAEGQPSDDPIIFTGNQDVEVTVGKTTVADFEYQTP
jgi:hypothetical protein